MRINPKFMIYSLIWVGCELCDEDDNVYDEFMIHYNLIWVDSGLFDEDDNIYLT